MTQPARRRDAIDVARILALFIVILGHLSLAVIDRPDDAVRGTNLLALYPGWAWVTVGSPMAVFFAAAGWANARSSLATATSRLRTMVGLGAVVVATWSAAVVLTAVITGRPGVIGSGARIATQPLWFLAAYIPLAAAGRPIARLADRHPLTSVSGCLVGAGLLDAVSFGWGAPRDVAWLGFLLVWATPWIVGAWWRARWESGGFAERRVGALLLVGFGLTGLALVAFAGYDAALIDAVKGGRSNTTPPTLYAAVAGLAQVGLLMIVARSLDHVGRRWRAVWDRLGEAAIGMYVWHLTALALCAGVIAVGLPAPERVTGWWWLTRPLWYLAVIGVTALLVAATAAARRALARRRPCHRPVTRPRATLGLVVATVAAALVGLRGPTTVTTALACTALFAGADALLRPATVAPDSSTVAG